MMRLDDLIICIAYFSIPFQILISLYQYPRLRLMPFRVVILLVLFAFFIFLCGAGHLLRCLDHVNTRSYFIVNIATSVVSLATALYLLPLVPSLMSSLDGSLERLVKLNQLTAESKQKLFTFMAFLCHEIRNPLFAITSSITCLEDTHLTGEQRIAVDSIQDSSLLMLRLVNDVLDLSKIDAGKLELEHHEFDLHRMLASLRNTVGLQIQQKHEGRVQLQFQEQEQELLLSPMEMPLPRMVRGDSTRILQIVYNLLSNAMKFTTHGKIQLQVTAEKYISPSENTSDECNQPRRKQPLHQHQTSETNLFSMSLLDNSESRFVQYFDEESLPPQQQKQRSSKHRTEKGSDDDIVMLKIQVTDTGCGIPSERISTIFQPYSQSKLSDYRKHGGTGLGLSILSGITNAMGGTIRCHSVEGDGATFVVRIPIQVVTYQCDGVVKQQHSTESHHLNEMVDQNVLYDIDPMYTSMRRLPQFNRIDSTNSLNVLDNRTIGDSRHKKKYNLNQTNKTEKGQNKKTVQYRSTNVCNLTSVENSNNIGPILVSTSSNNGDAKSNLKRKPKSQPLEKLTELAGANCKVLIVDDNCVNRKILGKMFSLFGLHYEFAQDGQQAIDWISQKSRNVTANPECPYVWLILMDLSMPVMDGFEAIHLLRTRYQITIPIVALTANALLQEKRRAIEAGATEFQTKPILRRDLHTICKRFLEAERSMRV